MSSCLECFRKKKKKSQKIIFQKGVMNNGKYELRSSIISVVFRLTTFSFFKLINL